MNLYDFFPPFKCKVIVNDVCFALSTCSLWVLKHVRKDCTSFSEEFGVVDHVLHSEDKNKYLAAGLLEKPVNL